MKRSARKALLCASLFVISGALFAQEAVTVETVVSEENTVAEVTENTATETENPEIQNPEIKNTDIEVIAAVDENDSVESDAVEIQTVSEAAETDADYNESEESEEAEESEESDEEDLEDDSEIEAEDESENLISLEEIEQQEAELKASYDEQIAAAANAKEKLAVELEYKRQLREVEDKRRAYEEAEAAKNRKSEENEEIEKVKAEYNAVAQEQKTILSPKTGAEAKIYDIEKIKAGICLLREDIAAQQDEYNEEKDLETEAKIQEIKEAEYRITETDSNGNPTKAAMEARKKRVAEVRAAAEKDKVQYGKELQASIQEQETAGLTALKKAYSALESETYTTNSFTNDITVRIGNFDGETGTWPLTLTSELFGYTTLFNQKIDLSYAEVTGEKLKPLKKMNEEEFENYSDNVELYDSIFRSATDIFYVSLSYKIVKWSWASQYRFEPVKCEIIRLGADGKNKVIHKVSAGDIKKVAFTVYPSYEVRSQSQIAKEQKQIASKIEREEKAHAKKNPVTPSVYGSETATARVSTGTSATAKAAAMGTSQNGRNLLLITGDTNFLPSSFSTIDGEHFGLDAVSVETDFKIGKFSFIGLEGSLFHPLELNTFDYCGGINFGFCARLSIVRPFIKAAVDVDNHLFTTGKAGGGLDFVMFKFADITIGYDYNWKFDTMSYIGNKYGSELNNYISNYHKVYAGVGFTW